MEAAITVIPRPSLLLSLFILLTSKANSELVKDWQLFLTDFTDFEQSVGNSVAASMREFSYLYMYDKFYTSAFSTKCESFVGP